MPAYRMAIVKDQQVGNQMVIFNDLQLVVSNIRLWCRLFKRTQKWDLDLASDHVLDVSPSCFSRACRTNPIT